MIIMPLGFIVTGGIIAIGVLAALAIGAFAGSQIDDAVEKPKVAIVPIKDELQKVIKWPLMIGGLILAVILAKKIGKKALK